MNKQQIAKEARARPEDRLANFQSGGHAEQVRNKIWGRTQPSDATLRLHDLFIKPMIPASHTCRNHAAQRSGTVVLSGSAVKRTGDSAAQGSSSKRR